MEYIYASFVFILSIIEATFLSKRGRVWNWKYIYLYNCCYCFVYYK